MKNIIIRSIIMVIAYICVEKIIKDLNTKKQVNLNENDNEYTVRMPEMLTKVYTLMFKFGIFLFFVFFIVKYIIHGSVDDGCFIVAIIVSAIGLSVATYSWKWRISVKGEQMEIQRLFHKSKKIKISEIEKVERENKKVRSNAKK